MKLKLLMFLSLTAMLTAQGITVMSDSGLNVTIGGEVEMEFVDVEGPGGFTNQDLTIQKVKSRSPHMRIDKAILSARVDYSENLYYQVEFRFGDDAANVDKHYARLTLPSINTRFELGKNKPMIATKRQSEGYPLIGTAFWKGREYHLTAESDYNLGENIFLFSGLSFAMKRPLGTDDAAEDKSFKMMVYDDYDNKDGQTFEYGGTLGLKAFGFTGQGWYYTGQLIDDFDWKTQLGGLPGYDEVADAYDTSDDDKTHWWYGGRINFDKWNTHLRAEYISSQDGLIPRDGYYVEGSYRFNEPKFLPVKNIEPIVRYGELNMQRHAPVLGDPETWDRQMTTIGLLTRLNDHIAVKIEYYLLDEVTGGEISTNSNNVTTDNTFMKDNQFLIQIKYEF
jgi:hypothetical protein